MISDGAAIAAIDRLIEVAKGEAAQGGPVTNFLLAWWNDGNFDLSQLRTVGSTVADDIATVFGLVARSRCTPEALGYRWELERLVADRAS